MYKTPICDLYITEYKNFDTENKNKNKQIKQRRINDVWTKKGNTTQKNEIHLFNKNFLSSKKQNKIEYNTCLVWFNNIGYVMLTQCIGPIDWPLCRAYLPTPEFILPFILLARPAWGLRSLLGFLVGGALTWLLIAWEALAPNSLQTRGDKQEKDGS